MTLKSKFLGLWDDLRSSFWFLPSLMAVASIVLSQVSLWFDRQTGATILNSVFFYTGTADGARSILSTIASSMIGLGGVVFSMTLVTLSLAAQQFGARTLRSLVRDRGNQAVLGIFISAFLFCLLVLRQVRGADEGGTAFVPQISMFVALVFALGGLIVLIYFIHHISFVIQAPHVISDAGADLVQEVAEPASGRWVPHFDPQALRELNLRLAKPIKSELAGYVRRIDYESLSRIASQHHCVFSVLKKSGDFVLSGETLLQFHPGTSESSVELATLEALSRDCYSFGDQRTQEQDLRFIVGQLLSIALLALSPAVNNPVQAILCIDRLTEALKKFAERPERGNYLLDASQKLVVIDPGLTFEDLFTLSFREIRLNSKTQLMVSLSLLESYRNLYSLVIFPQAKAVIEADYRKLFSQTEHAFRDELALTPRSCVSKESLS